jgi:flagellar hook-basal body complex protein FliE
MITPVSIPLSPPTLPAPSFQPPGPVEGSDGFGAQISQLLQGAQQQHVAADQSVKSFLTGNGGDVHNVMLAMEQARLSMMAVVEVRNKLVEAYQEVSRMPL